MKTSTKLLLVIMLTTVWSFTGQAQTTTSYGQGAGTAEPYNSFFGVNSGSSAAGGGHNGTYNSFFGYEAGRYTTIGHSNAFLGYKSGYFNTNGRGNVFLGMLTGYENTSGKNNVYIGYQSGRNSKTANFNCFIGFNSGKAIVSGHSNSFSGTRAGFNTTSGYNNSYFGYESGHNATGSNNVFLGYQAGYSETGSNKLYIDNSPTGAPLVYGEFNSNQLGINTNTIPTGYTLAVNGKIISEELKVRTFATWPDYVFEKGYKLKSLSQIETYIRKNGHLPKIPSAKEVAKNGFNVGEMNATLLEKVEELTLYAINQQKQVTAQNHQLIQQQQQIETLKKLVNKLLEATNN